MKFKNLNAEVKTAEGKAVGFDKNDFKAVKLNGKIKIVPNNVADTLVKLKRATLEKSVDIEIETRQGVSVKPLKK